jgi:hypothetical protein
MEVLKTKLAYHKETQVKVTQEIAVFQMDADCRKIGMRMRRLRRIKPLSSPNINIGKSFIEDESELPSQVRKLRMHIYSFPSP